MTKRSKPPGDAPLAFPPGWKVFPLHPGTKEPIHKGWPALATDDPEQIAAWHIQYPNANWGLACGPSNLAVVDVDGKTGEESLFDFELEHDFLPATREHTTPRGGRHQIYSDSEHALRNTVGKIGPKIDTRAGNGFIAIPPSTFEGKPYTVSNDVPIAPLPQVVVDAAGASRESVAASDVPADLPGNITRAQSLLANYIKDDHVAIEGQGGDALTFAVACEVLTLGLSPAAAFEVMQDWNECCQPPWASDELKVKIGNAERYAQNGTGAFAIAPAAEIFSEAAAKLNAEHVEADVSNIKSVVKAEHKGELESSVPGSEDDIACAFARYYSGNFKFIPQSKQWMAFEESAWREISTPEVWNLLMPIARSVATQFKEAAQRKITSRSTVSNVEALLRGNPNVVVPLDRWDSDPFLLNTRGKVIDLRTGKSRALGPKDFFMKSTAVEAAPEETDLRKACPLFFKFLNDITAGDWELQSYMQRMSGYCLTGLTSEHVMLFAYGTGANGKGVLFNSLTRVFGDYAKIAPVDTFTASFNERHPTDMAMLHGARLVAAQETDQGKYWAEAKIKALTGGDPISARFMHKDFFEYVPQFKLIVAGNHKPKLKNVDEAIRRRLHLVPFTVTIPESERDPELSEKLKAEYPGILRWAIKGCLAWQEHGLEPPAAVLKATSDYFSDQDPLESWLADRCIVGKGWTSGADLYGDFCAHFRTENGNEPPEGRRGFSQRLESRGFHPKRSGKAGTKGFGGITLKPALPFHVESLPCLDEGEL